MSVPERPIELILMRQLAVHLSVPTLLVDSEGALLFCNEAAEALLGRRLGDAGRLDADRWWAMLAPKDAEGAPLPAISLPPAVALRERRPAGRIAAVRNAGGTPVRVEITAFPLEGQGGRLLGAVAMFWSAPPS
jgi:PAS domain-containing protein